LSYFSHRLSHYPKFKELSNKKKTEIIKEAILKNILRADNITKYEIQAELERKRRLASSYLGLYFCSDECREKYKDYPDLYEDKVIDLEEEIIERRRNKSW